MRTGRTGRLVGIALAALALVTGVQGAQAADKAKLTVALTALDNSLMQVYLTRQLGYFAEENLDVEIAVVGSNAITQLVSGQADLSISGTSGALVPVSKGQETSIIYANTNGRAAGFVVGGNNVKTLADCKRMATQGVGTATAAYAAYLKNATRASYDIVPMGDYPIITATLSTGGVDCAVGSLGVFASLVAGGRAHLIVDQRDPSTIPRGAETSDVVTGAVFGMKKNLQSKRDAVTRFLRAYKKTAKYMYSKNGEELANALHRVSDFSPQSIDLLKKQVGDNLNLRIFAPADGVLDAAAWVKTATYFKNGGISSIDLSSPLFSYTARVDMTYYHDAAK